MTLWSTRANSDELCSYPTLSDSPVHRIQSLFSRLAPQLSAPGHSGNNPRRGSLLPAPGQLGRLLPRDPDGSARFRRQYGTCSQGLFGTTAAPSPASGVSPLPRTAMDRLVGGISRAPNL